MKAVFWHWQPSLWFVLLWSVSNKAPNFLLVLAAAEFADESVRASRGHLAEGLWELELFIQPKRTDFIVFYLVLLSSSRHENLSGATFQ